MESLRVDRSHRFALGEIVLAGLDSEDALVRKQAVEALRYLWFNSGFPALFETSAILVFKKRLKRLAAQEPDELLEDLAVLEPFWAHGRLERPVLARAASRALSKVHRVRAPAEDLLWPWCRRIVLQRLPSRGRGSRHR